MYKSPNRSPVFEPSVNYTLQLCSHRLSMLVRCWDPYLQKDCYMLEQVQTEFACKVCLKRWTIPYHDILSQLHIPSLKDSRKSMRLHFIQGYPWIFTLPISSTPIKQESHLTSLVTCTAGHYYNPLPEHFKNSFFPNTICLWNSLPADIISSTSLNIFRHYVTDACVFIY